MLKRQNGTMVRLNGVLANLNLTQVSLKSLTRQWLALNNNYKVNPYRNFYSKLTLTHSAISPFHF